MSDPKLISPLLDGFAMGAPISSHHGIRCCPAMRKNSDSKYIVKIISVPASQVQLDALLLTGAYKDPGDAMDYFKSLVDGYVAEAELLQKVSKLEGFLSYEDWQVVPMEDNRLGYQIYLLGSYKRSLDKYLRRTPLTGTGAIRMGLDLCNALTVSRRAGFLYIGLKPANVFLSDDMEYRIGDLGFVALDSLRFTSLSASSRSPYMAPEVLDPIEPLNATLDTYALGMMLYQIFNNNQLPEREGEIPAPANADGELSDIILKALAQKPEDRWEDPARMGQALAAYLQSGKITDAPIAPPAPAQAPASVSSDTQVYQRPAVLVSTDTQVFTTVPEAPAPAEKDGAETRVLPDAAAVAQAAEEAKAAEPVAEAPQKGEAAPEPQPVPVPAPAPQSAPAAAPAPQSAPVAVPAAQPAPAAAPQAVPAPKAAPQAAPAVQPAPKPAVAVLSDYDDEDDDYDDYEEDEDDSQAGRNRVRKPVSKGRIAAVVMLLVLALASWGGYYYYQNYYLQTIESMTIDGLYDRLTVNIRTEISDDLLTVSCTDTYGNSMQKHPVNGIAEFTDLLPNAQYKITVQIEGFHSLVGKTSDVFNTDARTEIISFTGIAGAEDGSVMLNFTVEGKDPEGWILTCTAEGEETKTETFTGHSVTVRGLTLDKTYSFTLSPSDDTFLIGDTTMEFTTSSLILAQNLAITAFDGTDMTVRWSAPEGVTVSGWTARCTSMDGFESILEVTDTKAVFSGLDPSRAYSVEVTAAGMTQPARTSISANPITITSYHVDEEDPMKLTVSWDYRGAAPEGGWILLYSLDGSNTQSVVKCESTTAVISPRVPGAEYKFVIQTADSVTLFGGEDIYLCPEAAPYEEHSFNTEKVTAYLLETPARENWSSADVTKDDLTDTFSVGQSISVLLKSSVSFYIPAEDITILYVIRDSDGNVISKHLAQEEDDWHEMWVRYNTQHCELDIPSIPTQVGSYTLSIYFNGMAVAQTGFTIVE